MTVPGPGAFSERTDTGGQPIRSLVDPGYGEQTEFRDQQKAAPLASADNMPQGPYPSDVQRMAERGVPSPEAGPSSVPEQLPSLLDPGDPDIPITAGAPMGAGPNTLTGRPAPEAYRLSDQLMQYAPADGAGSEALAWLAHTLRGMGQ